jgi:hypothetical protein
VNTYTGATTISAGTLVLMGSGSIANTSSLTNNSIFDISGATGNVSLTGPNLTTHATYTQASSATLKMAISPSANQLLTISGIATLAGTLNLKIKQKISAENAAYEQELANRNANHTAEEAEAAANAREFADTSLEIIRLVLDAASAISSTHLRINQNAARISQHMTVRTPYVPIPKYKCYAVKFTVRCVAVPF